MTIRDLAEVGARLEEAVAALPGDPGCSQELYERYESLAIVILDSEFQNYPEGTLEGYLVDWLRRKGQSLGVDEDYLP